MALLYEFMVIFFYYNFYHQKFEIKIYLFLSVISLSILTLTFNQNLKRD